MHDDELRRRLRGVAEEVRSLAPAFSPERIAARRPSAIDPRVWYAAAALAGLGAAAAVALVVMRSEPAPFPFDETTASWTGPTDFLLDSPGSTLWRTVPDIALPDDTLIDVSPDAVPDRGDTTGSVE